MAQESPINPNGYIGARSSRYYSDTEYPGFSTGPTDANGNVLPVGAPQPQSPLANVQGTPSQPGILTQFARSAVPYVASKIGSSIGTNIGAGQTPGQAVGNAFSPVTNAAGDVADTLGIGSAPLATTGAAAPGAADVAALPPASSFGDAGGSDAFAGPADEYGAETASNLVGSGTGSGAASAPSSFAGSLGGGVGAGIGTAAIDLATGVKPATAAKSGLGAGIGFAIGDATPLGPIGGVIGSAVGGAIGGRVICSELVAQGRMADKDRVADLDYTQRALTPYHVIGYLLWARPYVRLMQHDGWIGRAATNFIEPFARWRLEDVLYQLGRRERPNLWARYLIRAWAEPLCYVAGRIARGGICTRFGNEISRGR